MGRTPKGETRARVFAYMRERILAGAAPTVREVQAEFGFRSVQTAREHIEALIAEGRLAKEPGRARGCHLPRGDAASIRAIRGRRVPLLGEVAAGELTTAIENPAGYLYYEDSSSNEHFALRVRGKSMIGAGIFPDDIAIVRRVSDAENGAIVVALVGDEATVKRLKIRGKRIELHPENPDFSPILIEDNDDLQILGVVVEIRRKL